MNINLDFKVELLFIPDQNPNSYYWYCDTVNHKMTLGMIPSFFIDFNKHSLSYLLLFSVVNKLHPEHRPECSL